MSIDKPIMACGCAANAVRGDGLPVCVIHLGSPGATQVAATQPDLTGRKARCTYARRGPHDGHSGGRPEPQPVDSSTRLPFFKHCPDQPEDDYYCGCWGWD